MLSSRWASGWGDFNGISDVENNLPNEVTWKKASDIPATLQSELGHGQCLPYQNGLAIIGNKVVKFITPRGVKWIRKLTSAPLGRTTIVAHEDTLVVVGTDEALGIDVSDGSVRWSLKNTDVAKVAGWKISRMRCFGAWEGNAVIDNGWGYVLVKIKSGEIINHSSGLLYGTVSISGIITANSSDGKFRPILLGNQKIIYEETPTIGHINGMSKIDNVVIVLGESGCYGWDAKSGRLLWSQKIPYTDEADISRLLVVDNVVYHCAALKNADKFRVKTLNPNDGSIGSQSEIDGVIAVDGCGTKDELLFASIEYEKFKIHAMNVKNNSWSIRGGPECKMDVLEIPHRIIPDEGSGVWYFCTQGIYYASNKLTQAEDPKGNKKSNARTSQERKN